MQNIYDDAVSSSWTNWFLWDGMRAVWLFRQQISPTSTETHLAFKYVDIYCLGWWYMYNTHASSNLQFGEINTNGTTKNGCNIHMLADSLGESECRFDTSCKLYDTQILGSNDTSHPFYAASIITGTYLNINNVTAAKDVKIQRMANFIVRNNVAMNGIEASSYLGNVYNATSLYQNFKVTFLSVYYKNYPRLDTPTFTDATYQISHNSSFAAPNKGEYSVLIDPSCPNSTHASKLPVISWNDSVYTGIYNDIFQSMRLLVTDVAGTGISGASVYFYDVNGADAADFGTTTTVRTSDAQGYVWLEAITISSATSTTLTDSGKSWTTDAWIGRNVFIITGSGKNQLAKVKSNTATALTLCEALSTTPSANDLCGIVLEFKRARLTHKAASGNGTGAAYTDEALYTPHTIVIQKKGYETLRLKVTLDKPMNLVYKLRHSPTPWRDSMGANQR
jgi:hypothetical protein